MNKVGKVRKDDLPHILVVEDDNPTLESVLIKLNKEGFLTTAAMDGQEGIKALLKNEPFSLVLLDILMPQKDGFWFLEEKNKNSKIKNVPVVVFTNYSQPEYVSRALKLGVKGYLVKANHSLSDIVGEIKKCLEGGVCKIDK